MSIHAVVAFLIALNQNKGLIGSNGLLPADLYLDRVRAHLGGNDSSYLTLLDTAPTLFWWVPSEHLDLALDVSASVGLVLSLLLVVLGAGNVLVFFVLWALYQSLINIGQKWLGQWSMCVVVTSCVV